jgi:hypothetical protein
MNMDSISLDAEGKAYDMTDTRAPISKIPLRTLYAIWIKETLSFGMCNCQEEDCTLSFLYHLFAWILFETYFVVKDTNLTTTFQTILTLSVNPAAKTSKRLFLITSLSIREVLCSNLGWDTSCYYWDFSWMFSVPPDNCRESTLTIPLPISSKSLIDHYSAVRHKCNSFHIQNINFRILLRYLFLITESTKQFR